MGAAALSSRAIIGSLYYKIEQAGRVGWVPKISRLFKSDQKTETYPWLGQTPALREWVGERQAKGLRDNNAVTIENLLFEATLPVDVREHRRDHSGQINARIDDLASRAAQHWAKLLSTIINNGHASTSGLAYDGQFFFDTDHVDVGAPNQTAQDNDLASDISTLPVPQHGSITAPSAGELALSILAGVNQILGFKDDQSEPINDGASEFLVMVPVGLYQAALAAVYNSHLEEGSVNPVQATKQAGRIGIEVVQNSRLTNTSTVFVFRTMAPVPSFIRQAEVPAPMGRSEGTDADSEADIVISALAEGSEEEFKNHRHLYGVEASRNVGFAYWQTACRVELI